MKFNFKLPVALLLISHSIFNYSNAQDFDKNAVIEEIKKEIQEKELLAEIAWDAASKINNHNLGTIYNEVDANAHACFILSRLLNKNKNMFKIEYKLDFSDKSEENAETLRIESNSLTNYSIAAERLIKLTTDEQIIEWNLDCATRENKLEHERIPTNSESTFYTLINNGETLKILGKIEKGFTRKLINAVQSHPNVKTIALGSGGGLVSEALDAGFYIRVNNLDTTLYNNCYSACPLVLCLV